MRVILFHPVLLPPRHYGGVERVVLWLAKGLCELGHQVVVIAQKGSQKSDFYELLEWDQQFLDSLQPFASADIVHFMAPASKLWNRLQQPKMLTVHGNGKQGEQFPKNTVFLSKDHAQRHHAQVFVYNGIDPQEYRMSHQKKSNYLFLSKTSWSVKNLSGALSLCQEAGVPLQVAGGSRPWKARWQCWKMQGCHWLGPVTGREKAQGLAEAKALLFPIRWPEPFGLVVIESFMSGTPVLSVPRGSLKELVPQSVGALFENREAFIEMLRRERLPFEAEACRQWALKFHYRNMAEHYVKLYQHVIQGECLHPIAPFASGWSLESGDI